MIPIGNSAAALEPIGGEGIGLAMRSAELAVEAIDQAAESGVDVASLQRSFATLWRWRQISCRATALLFSTPGAALVTSGVDMVCFGPNDLSVALTGRLDIHAKEVKEAMTLVLRKCREMSVMGLIFANDVDYAKPLVAAGWNVVAVGTDADWFSKAAADMKREATGA